MECDNQCNNDSNQHDNRNSVSRFVHWVVERFAGLVALSGQPVKKRGCGTLRLQESAAPPLLLGVCDCCRYSAITRIAPSTLGELGVRVVLAGT